MEFTAEMIAAFLGGEIVGNPGATVSTFAKIEEGHQGALSFLSNPKYEHYIYDTDSSAVIVNKSFEPKGAVKATMIKVDDAYSSFAKLLELYAEHKADKRGISPKSDISESAVMGADCYVGAFTVIENGVRVGNNVKIYPNAYIGDNVTIGNNVIIFAGVKIYEGCCVGSNVIIHAGAVIGADGFGFAPKEDGTYSKIPQIGNVVIEDNVEIGANTCVDRATMGSTKICQGTKLDNLIQIGHNAVIGENTVFAAQVGVAGTSRVGNNCMFGGQVGVVGHVSVGNNVQVGSQSGITRSVPDNETWFGYPALPVSKYHRANAVFRNLPELSKMIYALDKQVKEMTTENSGK